MESLLDVLGRHPFLTGIRASHLEKLASFGNQSYFPPEVEVFREGEAADTFYLIVSGSVAITAMTDQAKRTIQVIGGDDILGWSWLVPPREWRFGATTLESTLAIALSAVQLRTMMETDKEFGYEVINRLMRIMAIRLEYTRVQLAGVIPS